MTYRILISDAIYDTRESLGEAKSLAITEAAMLAADTRLTIVCRVYRMGTPEIDMFGRDTSPAYFIGRAVATADSVTWEVGTARLAASRRLAA